MLFGKRIKELEDTIDVLEARANQLLTITTFYCQEVDRLSALYQKLEQKQEQKQEPAPKQPQKPRYRPRKNNGKENPKATE